MSHKYIIRQATQEDCKDIYRLIMELAKFEKGEDQVANTVKGILTAPPFPFMDTPLQSLISVLPTLSTSCEINACFVFASQVCLRTTRLCVSPCADYNRPNL